MAPCRRCDTDLLHCHGTLVRHGAGADECSADDCPGPVALHDLVIECQDVQAGCCADVVRGLARTA